MVDTIFPKTVPSGTQEGLIFTDQHTQKLCWLTEGQLVSQHRVVLSGVRSKQCKSENPGASWARQRNKMDEPHTLSQVGARPVSPSLAATEVGKRSGSDSGQTPSHSAVSLWICTLSKNYFWGQRYSSWLHAKKQQKQAEYPSDMHLHMELIDRLLRIPGDDSFIV